MKHNWALFIFRSLIAGLAAATAADAGRTLYQLATGFPPVNWSVSGRWFLMVLSGQPYVPDIVIINRYGRHGSLGLHQDKDESAASLAAGTPIVSISLGDSCVFVVGPPTVQVGGTPPPPSECQYVRLHSGDAIVFGGPSRLIWHGVKSVFSGSAPGFLRLPEKPCRLNLTMRRF